MDIGQHFRIIWRRRVPILLLSLLIAGLVYLWSSRQAKVYQAASQVSVDAAVGNSPNPEQARSSRPAPTRSWPRPRRCSQDAIEAADLPMNVNQLRGKLTVSHLVVGPAHHDHVPWRAPRPRRSR